MQTVKETNKEEIVSINSLVEDFSYDIEYSYDAGIGLNEKTIDYICDVKNDPDWIRDFRKRALRIFLQKPLPVHWASKELEKIDFDKIRF